MATEDIISLTEFKSDASGWIERLQSQPPVVITQNGRGRAVVQSYEAYRQMQDSMALLQRIRQAEADIAAGRVYSHDDVMTEVRGVLKAKLADKQKKSKTSRKCG